MLSSNTNKFQSTKIIKIEQKPTKILLNADNNLIKNMNVTVAVLMAKRLFSRDILYVLRSEPNLLVGTDGCLVYYLLINSWSIEFREYLEP